MKAEQEQARKAHDKKPAEIVPDSQFSFSK
jgi:hypothetical protein